MGWSCAFAIMIGIGGLLLCVGCGESVGNVEIVQGDARLQMVAGRLRYDGIPFTGRVVDFYPDSTQRSSAEYRNGLRDGTLTASYPDGTLMERRYFVEGRKGGVHEGWWEDGSPRFRYTFRDDLHEGEAREWFTNGRLYRAFNYVAGREEGEQIMYYEDGSVRANYSVVDGRRYGSIGAKPCRTEE